MTKLLRSISLSMVLLLTTGCFSVGVYTRTALPAESHHSWRHGFLWGIVGSELDGGAICGGRTVVRVQTYMSLGNMILYGLTGGLYAPMSANITCGQAPMAPAPMAPVAP